MSSLLTCRTLGNVSCAAISCGDTRLRRAEEDGAVRPTVLPNEGSTVGIKTGLATVPPIIEEDDAVCIGLVGSDGDALGRGSTVGELKGGEGGSLEPVGDGADMFHSSGFNGHDYTFLSTHPPYQFLRNDLDRPWTRKGGPHSRRGGDGLLPPVVGRDGPWPKGARQRGHGVCHDANRKKEHHEHCKESQTDKAFKEIHTSKRRQIPAGVPGSTNSPLYIEMSVHRNYALGSRLPHPAEFVVCTYWDQDENNLPFPWRFNKQTQAIDLEFVHGFNASTELRDEPMYFRGQSLRAAHNVLALGPNFVAWMENSQGADAGSVVMTENPILCDANVICPNQDPDNGATGSSSSPISFESSAGPLVSDYLKTMIFLKPLVVRYTEGGNTIYRYFTNNYEGNT